MMITKSDIQELFELQKFDEIYKLLYCSQDENLITEFIKMCFGEGDFFVPLITIYRVAELRHFPGLLRDEKNQALCKVKTYVKDHRTSHICEDLVELLKLGNKRGPDKAVLDDFLMMLICRTSFSVEKDVSRSLLSFRDIPSWTKREADAFIDCNFPTGSSGLGHMEKMVVEMCKYADLERVERMCNVCLKMGELDKNRFPGKEFMEIVRYASPDFRTKLVIEWTKEVGEDWVVGDAPTPRLHEIEQLVDIGIDKSAALNFLNEMINFGGLWHNIAALFKILLHKNMLEDDEIESLMKLIVSKCPHYREVRQIQKVLRIGELSKTDVILLKDAYVSKGNISSLAELSSQYSLNLNETDKNLCREKICGNTPMASDIMKFIDIFDLTFDEIADILQNLMAGKRLNTAMEIMAFCQSHCTQDQTKQLKEAFLTLSRG